MKVLGTAKDLAKKCIQEMVRTGNPVEFEQVLERYFQMLLDQGGRMWQEEQARKKQDAMAAMQHFAQMYIPPSFKDQKISWDSEAPDLENFSWVKKPSTP